MIRLLALFCALAAMSWAATSESIFIKNVHIHPVTAPEIENGSVLIVDGKIAEVGPKAANHGARVVDGHGLHLYPGLINAATNVGLEEIGSLRDTIDLDELGSYNPQLTARVAFNPGSMHIPVVRAAGITTVLTLPGTGKGAVFAGQGAVMHLDGWTWSDMSVRPGAVLDMTFPQIPSPAADDGPVGGKAFEELQKEHWKVLQELNDFFEEARRYQKAKAAGNADFKADPKLEAMIPVLTGERPLFLRAARPRAIREAVTFADKQKVRMILSGPEEIGDTGSLLASHHIPVILGNTLELPVHHDDSYDARYTLPAELAKAGVKFCFGTFDVQFARNAGFQAAAAAAFGLSPDDALKGVTINAAEILGVGDELGSIEKGKTADLILTDGDPLEAKTNIKMEFINGKEVDLRNKQTELYEKYLNRQ